MEAEKRRSQEAKNEVDELENIISIQEQLLAERNERGQVDRVAQSVASLSVLEKEVLKEDKDLWPSTLTIVDELIEQLQILSNRNSQIRSDANLCAAIASALRIKLSLPKVEKLRSSSSSLSPEASDELTSMLTSVTGQVRV